MATPGPRAAPRRDDDYEYRAIVLGGQRGLDRRVKALEHVGWELIGVSAPHYGSLTIVGRFRRHGPRSRPPGG
jgi:hypothetical protein